MSDETRIEQLEQMVWVLLAWIAQRATSPIEVADVRTLFQMLEDTGAMPEVLRDSNGSTRTRPPYDGRSYDDHQLHR